MFEVIPSTPARCADQLSRGDVEIGLIPSIEYPSIDNLRIIQDISIASMDEVRSILLVRPKNKKALNSVALDSTSRTSVVLTKILLKDVMGCEPEFVMHPPDLEAMLTECDAALLIGDSALAVKLEDYYAIDLARLWVQWQNKPFVFAFWACREGVSLSKEELEAFQKAKEWGLNHRAEIASVFSEKLGLPREFLENYLHFNINYDLGREHIRGLEAYYSLAVEGGHIPAVEPLRFLG